MDYIDLNARGKIIKLLEENMRHLSDFEFGRFLKVQIIKENKLDFVKIINFALSC